ncbi:MAG TPA: hypothetical protein VF973_15030 [Myxococcales bacterium]
MPADLIARARESLPPDLYQQPAYLIVRPLWSLLGRVYRVHAPDGRLAMFVRHPIFRIRDRLILFADEDETIPLLEIRNRSLLSFNMCHDVLDALTGVRLGAVRTRGLSWMWRDAWDVLDPDDRVCGTMQEDTLSLVRRVLRFWPGRHHIEIGGEVVALLAQQFRLFRKVFALQMLPASQNLDPRFLIACALVAVMADVRRESHD